MEEQIRSKIQALSNELDSLVKEKEYLFARGQEIDIRMHQLVGAIFELQNLLNPVSQPSENPSVPDHQD